MGLFELLIAIILAGIFGYIAFVVLTKLVKADAVIAQVGALLIFLVVLYIAYKGGIDL